VYIANYTCIFIYLTSIEEQNEIKKSNLPGIIYL
jgi:hypothetical protein